MEDAEKVIEEVREGIESGKSDEEIFQVLLPSLGKNSQTDEKAAEALATIYDTKAAKLLHRMLEVSKEKKVQKAIRRSLYRLKIKGVFSDEPPSEKGVSILRPPKTETPQGFGSAVDFLGRRLLVLAIPHPGMGLMVIQGLVSDTKGLVDVAERELARKKFKFFLDDLQKTLPFPLVEIEPSYAGFLLTESYRLTVDSGGPVPKGYVPLRREIERLSRRHDKPPIYAHIQEDDIAADDRSLERGGDLLKVDLFSGWRIEEERIRSYADAVTEANESKIVLAQAQKEARFQEIYLQALTELFPEGQRLLYRRRLEEMAYLLFKLGRKEDARICLATAMDMGKPMNPIQPNPFLFHLVVNSIHGHLAEVREKEKKEPSLIVKP